MFYTYVLESRISNNIYVGSTSDLEKRLREHNSGKMQSTKSTLHGVLFTMRLVSTRKTQGEENNIGKQVKEEEC